MQMRGVGGSHGQTRLAWLGEHSRGGMGATQLRGLCRRRHDDLPVVGGESVGELAGQEVLI